MADPAPTPPVASNYCCSQCAKISTEDAMQKCSRCSRAFYCGRDCQVAAWPDHKKVCLRKSPVESAVALRTSPLRIVFDAPSDKDRSLIAQVLMLTAVSGGSDKLARALLRRGANPSSVSPAEFTLSPVPTKTGLSALHIACFGSLHRRTAREITGLLRLLAEEAQVPLNWTRWAEMNSNPQRQGTPLGAALYGRSPDAVRFVLRAVGAQALATPGGGSKATEIACVAVGARALVDTPCWWLPPCEELPTGGTLLPLHVAAAVADCDTLELLLQAGADVSALTPSASLSALELALHVSCRFIRSLAVDEARAAFILLRAGASPLPSKQRIDSAMRCIDVAGMEPDPALFCALVAAGADPTPLPFRMKYNGASQTFGSFNYMTMAVEFGRVHTVEAALRAGVSVNTRASGASKSTLLLYAAHRGYADLVDLLLAWRADVNAACEFWLPVEAIGSDGVQLLRTATDAALHPFGAIQCPRIISALRAAGGRTTEELRAQSKPRS